jgi:hypothetical protein
MDETEALFTHTFWGEAADEPFDPAQVVPGTFAMDVLGQADFG